MSNSFTSPPLLTDPARCTAGLTIRTTEIARLADSQNYSFAYGGTHNVVSQSWVESCFRYNTTSSTKVCEWYIPRPSREHSSFVFRLNAFSSASGNQFTAQITFALSGNTYSTTDTITDSGRYSSQFDDVTVSITADEAEEYCILSLYLNCVSGGIIDVCEVQGSWDNLSSPLSAGVLQQAGDDFIPQGQSRQGADLPLSARFGVQTLNNIVTLRKRGRVLLNWSGAFDSASFSLPPIGIGIGEQQLLYSMVALFAGMREAGLEIDVFLKVVNLGVGQTLQVDVFGYRLTCIQSGWNSFGLGVVASPDHYLSGDVGLDMYRVGIDETPSNQANLLSIDNRQLDSVPYVQAISIIGV
jgi:hypothetical protein